MALIPDEAIESMDEISPSAWKVYCLLCKFRSKESGESWPAHKTIEQVTGVHYTRIGDAKRQLVAAGWIEITKDGRCQLLKGFAKCKGESLQNANPDVCKMQSEGLQNAKRGFAKCKTPPRPPYRGGTSILNQEREPERERDGNVLLPLSTPVSSKNQTPVSAPDEHPAITAYKTEFGISPTAIQAQAITATVHDLEHYRTTLHNWKLNGWRPTSVNEQLDRYKRTAPAWKPEPVPPTPSPLPEAPTSQAALVPVSQQAPTSSTLMQFGRPGTAAEFQRLPFVLQNAITEEALEAKKKREDEEFFAQVAAKALARKQQRMIENYGR